MLKRGTSLLVVAISLAIVIQGVAIFAKSKKSTRAEKETAKPAVASVKENIAVNIKPEMKADIAPVEVSPLAIELLGTIIGNSKEPMAYIKDLDMDKESIYKLGDKIQDAKLVKITLGQITVERNGKTEVINMSSRAASWSGAQQDNSAVISIKGDNITVNKQGLLNETGNVLSTLPQVKVKPYYEAEKVAGLIIDGIPNNSIIAAAGIRNKDVVKSVNNQCIDSYQKALQVFQKVRNQSEIRVTLLRDGRIQNLCYLVKN